MNLASSAEYRSIYRAVSRVAAVRAAPAASAPHSEPHGPRDHARKLARARGRRHWTYRRARTNAFRRDVGEKPGARVLGLPLRSLARVGA